MQTRCRKLKVIDTTYVFRVPVETSLDPLDIIKAGRVLTIKVGMKPIEDVNGNILGKSGRGGNGIKEMIVEPSTEIKDALIESIKKTRRIIEAEQLHPDATILPKLSVHKHRGELIRRETAKGDYYFIPSKAFCDNCKLQIDGITKLEINGNGKVCKELPFEGSAGSVKHPAKDKWLHEFCASRTCIDPPATALDVCTCGHPAYHHHDKVNSAYKGEGSCVTCDCDGFVLGPKSPTAKLLNEGVPERAVVVNTKPEELLIEVLKRQDLYSAEFARGASLMFMAFQEIR